MEQSRREVRRRILVAAVAIAVLAAGAVAIARRSGTPSLEGRKEKLSYALGLDLGDAARKQGLDVDPALASRGLADALSGARTLLSEEEARATLLELQGELKAKRLAAQRELAEKNEREGAAYLAENGTKEGVVTLPSGLQYRILKAGQGRTPSDGDIVECSYRGARVDGTPFDSSERRGGRARLPVSALIPGWREALKLMPVGSRWELVVPPQLAYGASGPRNAPVIGPNATLVYDIELFAAAPRSAGAKASGRAARFQAR